MQRLIQSGLMITLAGFVVGLPSQVGAGVRDEFDFNGGFHDGIFGWPLNDMRRFTTTATSTYTLQGIRFEGSVLPEPQAFSSPPFYPSWGRDLFARITHERTATQMDIRLGYGTEWIQRAGGDFVPPASATLTGVNYQMAGLAVQPGDAFTVELWDAFDDLPGADATWSNLTWSFTDDVIPQLGPVPPGRIRIDATGLDSFPTVNALLDPVAGSTFWGIEYGSGSSAQPAITSVTLDTQDVGEVWWQNGSQGGQFVVGDRQGIDQVPTLTNGQVLYSLEDPLQDGNFQRLEIGFADGDFGPGDSLRFGNDIDSFATAEPPFVADIFSSGADFARYQPGLRVIVRFADGSTSEGLLNQVAPGVSTRSYVDLLVPGGVLLQADFNFDGQVDGQDYLIWQQNYLTPRGATRATGDADGNGRIDGADFLIWQTELTRSPADQTVTIPEPTAVLSAWSLLLIVTAILPRLCRGTTS